MQIPSSHIRILHIAAVLRQPDCSVCECIRIPYFDGPDKMENSIRSFCRSSFGSNHVARLQRERASRISLSFKHNLIFLFKVCAMFGCDSCVSEGKHDVLLSAINKCFSETTTPSPTYANFHSLEKHLNAFK